MKTLSNLSNSVEKILNSVNTACDTVDTGLTTVKYGIVAISAVAKDVAEESIHDAHLSAVKRRENSKLDTAKYDELMKSYGI